jgi:hypothetical protein
MIAAIVAAVNTAEPSALPEWERYRVQRAEHEFASVRKERRVAYLLWCLTGLIGRSIAMLFTLGGLGVWTLLDVFLIGRRVEAVNRNRRERIMARYGILDAAAL